MKTTTTTTKAIIFIFTIGLILLFISGLPAANQGKTILKFISEIPEMVDAFWGSLSLQVKIGLVGLLLIFFASTFYKRPNRERNKSTSTKGATQNESATPPAPVEPWKPWLHIQTTERERIIIQLWCEGKSADEISKEVFLGVDYIRNIISRLRKKFPEAKIPTDQERKKQMRFLLSQ